MERSPNIVDLTQPISSGMDVYPGYPQVTIEPLFSIQADGYSISKMSLGNHTGTHIDVPSHMIEGGKNLDSFSLDTFEGRAVKYSGELPEILNPSGEYSILILDGIPIDENVVEKIAFSGFKMVGHGEDHDWTIQQLTQLLSHDIPFVGHLTNLDQLPETFYFSAQPLPLQEGNGAPVRAIARLETKPQYPTPELFRIGDIAVTFYGVEENKLSKTLIIYGIGAPRPPDNGDLPDADIIRRHGVDIFVPDYIGSGRSDGEFTPKGCIDTFTTLYDEFTKGTLGTNSYSQADPKFMQYDRIVVVGRSLGGTYVPVLPRFDPRIKELAIIYPVVDSKSQNTNPDLEEESNERFMESMRRDGYHHLYRGIVGQHEQLWLDHLENHDDLSPMDNMQYLDGAKLFVGHGDKDIIVHYSKSEEYIRRLHEIFPDQVDNFRIKIVSGGGHGASTSKPAMDDFLDWIDS